MSRLVVNGQVWTDASKCALDTSDTVASVVSGARAAAASCGHDTLAARLDEFAEAWERQRIGLVDSLTALALAVALAVDTFDELEQQVAADAGGSS